MSENKTKEYDIDKCPFSWDKLDGLLAYKPSAVTCAEMLGVHVNTIKNHIRERFDMTFSEYADQKLAPTKVKLVQKALDRAFSGNSTMLIFCLKNINKWCDNVEQKVDGNVTVEGYGLAFDLTRKPENKK